MICKKQERLRATQSLLDLVVLKCFFCSNKSVCNKANKKRNGAIKLDVLLQNETVWMSQNKIAELFDVQRPAITKHLKNIFESGELKEKVVVSILELTTLHDAISDKKCCI